MFLLLRLIMDRYKEYIQVQIYVKFLKILGLASI